MHIDPSSQRAQVEFHSGSTRNIPSLQQSDRPTISRLSLPFGFYPELAHFRLQRGAFLIPSLAAAPCGTAYSSAAGIAQASLNGRAFGVRQSNCAG